MKRLLVAAAIANASFIIGSSAVAVAAPPVPLVDYKVKAGDNCAGIARRLFGDSHRIDLIHRFNNLGPSPHHLKAGMVLRLPASLKVAPPLEGTGEPDAHLTFLRNSVDSFTPEQHHGKRDEALNRGHRVSTAAASSAEVTFLDESQLQLAEHTLVVILGETRSTAQQKAGGETTLVTGSLRMHLGELAGKKQAPAVGIATSGGAHIAVGQGEAQVGVDEKKTTRLSVYRGRSKMKSADKEVVVPEGFGTSAAAGAAPAKPHPLPPAPTWSTPPTIELAGDRGTAAWRGGYAPGEGSEAAQFHVQLARDERFNDLIVETRVPASVNALAAVDLPVGAYLARVSAFDSDGLEGPFSAVAKFTVVAAVVDEGTPARTASVALPPGMTCTLDGKPVSAPSLPLTPGKDHVLSCSAAGGAPSELNVPASRCGRFLVGAHALDGTLDGTEVVRGIEIAVSDVAGAPVDLPVELRLPRGASATPLMVTTPGVSRSTVRWAGGDIEVTPVIAGHAQTPVLLEDVPRPRAPRVFVPGETPPPAKISPWRLVMGAALTSRFGAHSAFGGLLEGGVRHEPGSEGGFGWSLTLRASIVDSGGGEVALVGLHLSGIKQLGGPVWGYVSLAPEVFAPYTWPFAGAGLGGLVLIGAEARIDAFAPFLEIGYETPALGVSVDYSSWGAIAVHLGVRFAR